MSEIKDAEFPYDETKQKQIKAFFHHVATKKEKKKEKFFYKRNEKTGNLETYDKKSGDLVSSIPLYYYRPITSEEYQAMDKKRLDDIIALEEQIDIQKGLLRTAYNEYISTNSAENFIKINNEVKELELKRNYLRSPIRIPKIVESIETRNVDFDKIYEVRKAYDIQFMIYRDFPLWKLYGRYSDSKEVFEEAEKPSIVLLAGEVFLKNGKIARIFNDIDNENNNLSIFIQRDFVYENVRYASPYQAFEAIRLNELGYTMLRDEVLKTRGSRLIKIIGKKINKPIKNTKNVWHNILYSFYTQHEDLIEILFSTKNDVLVFANNIPYLGGIGIVAGTDDVLDTSKWKAHKFDSEIIEPNLLGNVLMELRTEFKQINNTDLVKVGGTFTESAKTASDAEKQKKTAIINYMKKR